MGFKTNQSLPPYYWLPFALGAEITQTGRQRRHWQPRFFIGKPIGGPSRPWPLHISLRIPAFRGGRSTPQKGSTQPLLRRTKENSQRCTIGSYRPIRSPVAIQISSRHGARETPACNRAPLREASWPRPVHPVILFAWITAWPASGLHITPLDGQAFSEGSLPKPHSPGRRDPHNTASAHHLLFIYLLTTKAIGEPHVHTHNLSSALYCFSKRY